MITSILKTEKNLTRFDIGAVPVVEVSAVAMRRSTFYTRTSSWCRAQSSPK